MTDNQLFTLVRGILLAQLPTRGLDGWKVARKFQPLQNGANAAPTVYVFKVADKRHGSPQQRAGWNPDTLTMDKVESQQMETTFQASIEMDEGTDANALTPSDAANEVAAIMQSDEALAALQAQGVGILRIGAVLNPYNVNDRNRFDANPSFDFVLTYRRARTATTPHAVSVEGSINRV
jgi:hypothetical protein